MKMDQEKILNVLFWILIGNSIVAGVYLSMTGNIYGIDAWWWADFFQIHPFFLINFVVVGFYFTFGRIFHINSTHKKTALLLGIVLLSSLASERFLEFEPDDFLLLSMTIILTVMFPRYSVAIGLVALAGFVFIHDYHSFNFYGEQIFQETKIDYTKIFNIVPVIYILAWNRKWWQVGLLVGLFTVFPFNKFAVSGLMFLIIPMLYQLRNEELKYNWKFLALFVFSFVLSFWIATDYFVTENAVSLDMCVENVCDNSDQEDWWRGHYLKYKGYEPTDFPTGIDNIVN